MKKEKRARARRTGAQAAESGAARPAGGAGKTLRALGFAQKLTLAMLLVLAMALSLGGAVVLAGNFDDALNEAGQQAEVQHLLQCYALESDLLDVAARGETVTDSHLARYGSSLEDYVGGKLVALYRGDAAAQGGTSSAAAETETEAEAQAASDAERQPAALRTVYTSFPWDEGPTGQTDTYRMHRDGGRTYMLFEAEVETVGNPPVTLLTGHDVTSVFAARDRALLRFWEMELVVLVCAGAMIALLSRWLTKPLARLTQASESIAGGAYGERTGLSGGDEIGVLSRSFDAMAAAVQEKVDALELSVRQREDFMSAFTHELKTPMTAVIGYADTLRSMQCEPEQQQRAAHQQRQRGQNQGKNCEQHKAVAHDLPGLIQPSLSHADAHQRRTADADERGKGADHGHHRPADSHARQGHLADVGNVADVNAVHNAVEHTDKLGQHTGNGNAPHQRANGVVPQVVFQLHSRFLTHKNRAARLDSPLIIIQNSVPCNPNFRPEARCAVSRINRQTGPLSDGRSAR